MATDEKPPFRMTPLTEDEGSPAMERVAGPASGLMVVAVLAALTNCFGIMALSAVLREYTEANETRPQGGVSAEGGAAAGRLLSAFCGMVPSFGIYGIVFRGGLRMRSLTSHQAATTAAWIALLPLSPAVVVSLPVGIWALRVLGDPEIQRAFDERRD